MTSSEHSCDSYACGLILKSPMDSYKFIPQFELCDETKEINNNIDKHEYHYCNNCS
jgi:hypothetical protein